MLFIFLVLAASGLLIWLPYYILQKSRYAKFAKVLPGALLIILLFGVLLLIFGDMLFTKSQAKSLLMEQQIILQDEFELKRNTSMIAPGDYYQVFELKISEKDRNAIINQIRTPPNFLAKETPIFDLLAKGNPKEHEVLIQNYETETDFVTEMMKGNGKQYVPLFRRISISKAKPCLVFEDIDE